VSVFARLSISVTTRASLPMRLEKTCGNPQTKVCATKSNGTLSIHQERAAGKL
jgi:hypothetical protein